jgi:putative cell wall-binding protein
VAERSADAVVVARADHFADALVGAPLAGANGGPVLLSARDGVRDAVVHEARRVLRSTGTVYLMGGPGALSPALEAAFAGQGLRTQRVAGIDRYQTAVKTAALLAPAPSTVLLASGEAFPDALSAGVPAAVHRMPVLLTGRDALPSPTAAYLGAHRAARRVVVGGSAAVSEAVARQAGAAERVAGSNRYATAVRIAQRWFPRPGGVWAATGERHQDALVAVPAAARARRPLLLLPPSGERTLYDYSRQVLGGLGQVTAVGGPAGVREPVLSLLFN